MSFGEVYGSILKEYPDILTVEEMSKALGVSSKPRGATKRRILFYGSRTSAREERLFYMVLSYPDITGKRKTKWFPTGLPVKGNKKRAEKMLMQTRQNFEPECTPVQDDMMFSDFLLQWLEIAKPTIALTTYASYAGMAKIIIIPYFKERNTTLAGLKAIDIQTFYMQ